MIPLGKKDKIRNQDLSKALNRQFKIKSINNISTFKKYTTFSMPKKDFDRIKSTNRNFRFNSQSVEIKQYARS